jgi:hypothetical protein
VGALNSNSKKNGYTGGNPNLLDFLCVFCRTVLYRTVPQQVYRSKKFVLKTQFGVNRSVPKIYFILF